MLHRRLGDEIRQLIQETKKSNKEVAGAFAERMGLNINTVTSDLSELVNGKPGSERKFFSRHEQRQAFAQALEVDLERLEAIFGYCDKRRYLVLDPALTADVRDFLMRQQESDEAGYECVEVQNGGDLGKTAKAAPGCVVALRNDADLRIYELADIAAATVRRVPRGFELLGFSGLVPIPRAAPAPAWNRGAPMFSHPDLVADIRREAVARKLNEKNIDDARRFDRSHEREPSAEDVGWLRRRQLDDVITLARHVFSSDKTETEPSFPLSLVLPWLEARGDAKWRLQVPQARRDRLHDATIDMTLEEAEGKSKSTTVWWWQDRLFAVGPSAEALRRALLPLHDVEFPASLRVWQEALKTRNPFGNAFAPLVKAAAEEAGISLAEATRTWAECVHRGRFDDGASGTDKPTKVKIERWTEDAEAVARTAIGELAARAMVVPLGDETVSLRLRSASRAPLALLEKNRFDAVHAIASLGAGRVLHIRIAQFEGDAEGELTVTRPSRGLLTLDGDGTHAWIESSYDEELEGMFVRARARRAEEANASDYDDYYVD